MIGNNTYLITVIMKYLKAANTNFKYEEMLIVLLSDPDYPSLKSVINTLRYFGIITIPYQADYSHFIQLQGPLIIHSNKIGGGHFYYGKVLSSNEILVDDGEKKILCKDAFLQIWDGIVVCAKSRGQVSASANHRLNITLVCVMVLIGSFILAVITYDSFVISLLLSLVAACLLCQQLNSYINDFFKSRFCKVGKHVDCNTLKKVKYSKHIAVIGLFYVLMNYILLVCASGVTILSQILSILALAFIAVLLAYQIRIKKFCVPCGLIALSIGCNSVYKLSCQSVSNDLLDIIIASFFSAIATAAFVYMITNDYNKIRNKIKLLRFKRNKDIFNFLLSKSEMYSLEQSRVIFGKQNSKCVIKTVVSLDCRHCKQLCRAMAKLVKSGNDVRWELYFDGFIEGKETIFMRQLKFIQAYFDLKEDALTDFMKVVKRSDKVFEIEEATKTYLKAQLLNLSKINIQHVPLILFNDRMMPKGYDVDDLKWQFL